MSVTDLAFRCTEPVTQQCRSSQTSERPLRNAVRTLTSAVLPMCNTARNNTRAYGRRLWCAAIAGGCAVVREGVGQRKTEAGPTYGLTSHFSRRR